jgi:hypothetical protein
MQTSTMCAMLFGKDVLCFVGYFSCLVFVGLGKGGRAGGEVRGVVLFTGHSCLCHGNINNARFTNLHCKLSWEFEMYSYLKVSGNKLGWRVVL